MIDNSSNLVGSGPPLSLFSGRFTLENALDQVRMKLLDLSSRSPLINFRPSKATALQVVHAIPNAVYNNLLQNNKVRFEPVPSPSSGDFVGTDRSSLPDIVEFAKKKGIKTSYELNKTENNLPATGKEGRSLQVLLYPEHLERQCRRIAGAAQTVIQETGSNMLYLVFGFLEWYETDYSDKQLLSPLIAVPVSLKKGVSRRGTAFNLYDLNFTGEEPFLNPSVQTKLAQEKGMQLPIFSPEKDLPQTYFDKLEDIIGIIPRWKVRNRITLTLLSFAKLLIHKDLDPTIWPIGNRKSALLEHTLVRTIFGELSGGDTVGAIECAHDIDKHPQNDISLIFDADSSQHLALLEVLAGRNLVIDGPPGTGKSQTIANLIAELMVRGKKILFVSEKVAALEVVRTRLEKANLGDFCLELHSNKSNRKQVVDNIKKRYERIFPKCQDFEGRVRLLQTKKLILQQYADLMNSRQKNALGLTVHEILWRAEKYRQILGPYAADLERISIDNTAAIGESELNKMESALIELATHSNEIGHFDNSHPWFGFFPTQITRENTNRIRLLLDEIISQMESVTKKSSELLELCQNRNVDIGPEAIGKIGAGIRAIEDIGPNVRTELLSVLFPVTDPSGQEAIKVLEKFDARLIRYSSLISHTNQCIPKRLDITKEIWLKIKEAHAILKRNKLQSKSLDLLVRTILALREIRDGCKRSLDALRRVFVALKLEGDLTIVDLLRTCAIMQVCLDAPIELLGYRTSAMGQAEAKQLFDQLESRLTDLDEQTTRLSKIFRLDDIPSEKDLIRARKAFLKGKTLLSFFNCTWRYASRLYKTAVDVKTMPDERKCASNLAELLFYVRSRDSFSDFCLQCRSSLGTLATGEKIDLDKLGKLVNWCVAKQAELSEANVPSNQFNLTEVQPHDIARYAQYADEFGSHLNNLLLEMAKLPDLIRDTTLEKDILNEKLPLIDRVRSIQELQNELSKAASLLIKISPRSASGDDIVRAVLSRYATENLHRKIEMDKDAERLLGEQFVGVNTDLRSAADTLEWGCRVYETELPPVMKRLIYDKPAIFLEKARVTVQTLQSGWESLQTFAEELQQLGEFKWGQWTLHINKQNCIDAADRIRQKACYARENLHGLLPWSQYLRARTNVEECGLSLLAQSLTSIPGEFLLSGFRYRFFATIAEEIFKSNKALYEFSGTSHAQIREEFAKLDREIISLRGEQSAERIANKAATLKGKTGLSVNDRTEMELLNHLFGSSKPRTTIRRMLSRASKSIQELKPCFMMGPLSVAQYLEPGAIEFDIVIMDEASQLRPEEAIGAISRAKQLVVVGDPKQLPPTSFFDKNFASYNDDENEDFTDLVDNESILDICTGRFPTKQLTWHYRSRHQSLIAFSNHHFYDGKLIVFPTPFPPNESLGVRYIYVGEGIYDNRQNLPEAKRVVKSILDHIEKRPEESLGVVTLNIRQRDLIEEILETEIRKLPESEKFREKWEQEGMPLFIKNLENVQGDERHTIFISTTFGKAPKTNVVRQNFGPISRQSGWRRLNVLFTRAQRSVHVFSSMRPEDIVVDSKTPDGTSSLRKYLDYASNGALTTISIGEREPESDFEVAVAEVLRNKGFEVVPQFGVAGFFIDIVVRNPDDRGQFLAAIECDGASYHSGFSVRDRDRIRQEVLESLGWKGKIWRIWSPDWYRNPLGVTEKLLKFLEDRRLEQRKRSSEFEKTIEVFINQASQVPLEKDLEEAQHSLNGYRETSLVKVGDSVEYIDETESYLIKTVRILNHRTGRPGETHPDSPLARALLGGCEGDTVELQLGENVRPLTILKIVRGQLIRS